MFGFPFAGGERNNGVVTYFIGKDTRMVEVAMAKHTIAAKDEMIALQSDFDKLIEQSGLQTPCIKKLAVYL